MSSSAETSNSDQHAERYLPTPAQIAAACAEIRAGWTPDERRRRQARPQLEPVEPELVEPETMEDSPSEPEDLY